MNRVQEVFQNKAFIPFVTAGDPNLDVTEPLLAEVNKQNIEFKPVTHDEKPQAAPAAGSDKKVNEAPAAPAAPSANSNAGEQKAPAESGAVAK